MLLFRTQVRHWMRYCWCGQAIRSLHGFEPSVNVKHEPYLAHAAQRRLMARLQVVHQQHSRALQTQHRLRAWCGGGWAGCKRPRAVSMAASAPAVPISARLVVVGDVHDQWSDADEAALAHLDPDMALFVGDFGNENVQLVQRIAAVDTPKAVILGNHDAWYSMSAARQAKLMSRRTLLNSAAVDLQAAAGPKGVPRQLAALGDAHVGYATLQVPGKPLNIVGARPFSKGGDSFGSIQQFMRITCGVSSPEQSTQRIVQVATTEVPKGHSIVMMGHNGPAGLGDQRHDIVGVDFRTDAGDHGDTDLTQALAELAANKLHVSAVVFGHMHNSLRGGGHRRMVQVAPTTGTVYLNAAVVPRVTRGDAHTAHHFVLMDLLDGQLEAAWNVWVHVTQIEHMDDNTGGSKPAAAAPADNNGALEQQYRDAEQFASAASSSGRVWDEVASSSGRQRSSRMQSLAARYKAVVAEKEPLLKTVYGDNGVVQSLWDGYEGQWRAVVLSAEAAARHTGRTVEQDSEWPCASDATDARQVSGPGSTQHGCSPPEQEVTVLGLQGGVQPPQERHSLLHGTADVKRARLETAATPGPSTSSRSS